MTASTNGSGAGAGGEAPANTVQVGGWTLSADLSPEAMAQVQGLISGMQNESSGPARQAVERPDGSIEFPERSDDDKAAADAAFEAGRAAPGRARTLPRRVRGAARRRRARRRVKVDGKTNRTPDARIAAAGERLAPTAVRSLASDVDATGPRGAAAELKLP